MKELIPKDDQLLERVMKKAREPTAAKSSEEVLKNFKKEY